MNSIEAAALYLSDGATKDPNKAALMAQGDNFNMDALQRSHLQRMMGFEFELKLRPNKLHVSSKVEPYVSTWCRIVGDDLADEAQIDKLVDACLRLKIKYETAKAKK